MANNNHLYSDRETRLNTLIGQVTDISVKKYEHWRSLQRAKNDFEDLCQAQGRAYKIEEFYAWLETTYGIRLQQVEGMIGPEFNIINEQKYLIYQLKFA